MRFVALMVVLAGCGRLSFDAGAPDATTDGRSPDAASDSAAATTCGTASVLACDGFEGALDPMWILDTAGGTVTLDTARAYRGTSSVHVRINPITSAITDPRATLRGPAGLATPVTGTVYIRAWLYVASPLDSAPLFTQVLNAADGPGNGISMGVRNGNVVNNDYTDVIYAESATAFPLDRWACVQFAMPSNTAGTSRVWLDDTELTDVALTKTTLQPAPSHVYLGLEWVGTTSSMPAADAWLDEIVVDSQPISCAQ